MTHYFFNTNQSYFIWPWHISWHDSELVCLAGRNMCVYRQEVHKVDTKLKIQQCQEGSNCSKQTLLKQKSDGADLWSVNYVHPDYGGGSTQEEDPGQGCVWGELQRPEFGQFLSVPWRHAALEPAQTPSHEALQVGVWRCAGPSREGRHPYRRYKAHTGWRTQSEMCAKRSKCCRVSSTDSLVFIGWHLRPATAWKVPVLIQGGVF